MRKAWVATVAAAALVLAACDRGGAGRAGERADAEGDADAGAAAGAASGSAPAEAPTQTTRRAARGKRAATAASSVRHVEGKLERATSERVVIRPRGHDPLTLRIGEGTSVTLDGRAARAETLPQGTDVRAAYQNGNGRARALSIEARTGEASPGSGEGRGGSGPRGGRGGAGTAQPGDRQADAVWQRNTGERGSPGGG